MTVRPRLVLVLVLATVWGAACGASPPPPEPLPPAIGRAIGIEWKTAQGDGDLVVVTLVVDGKPIELGTLPAATEMEAGSPRTCALRAAHPLRTELTCGEMTSFYAAELIQGELVISLVEGSTRREIQRVPAMGEGLAVKPYALPD